MGELRGDLDLAQKSLRSDGVRQLGLEKLDRDLPSMSDVIGEIDGCHPAAADLALDSIAPGQGRT
jgi:hypothetical protein